jgi:hypothetical protein
MSSVTPATVTINVLPNHAPTTVADTATAPRRTVALAAYPAVLINVLSNDSDPDTVYDATNTINPASAVITGFSQSTATPTANRATATINNAGVISYKPALGFTGIATITYTVRDTRGLVSSPATVSVTVP